MLGERLFELLRPYWLAIGHRHIDRLDAESLAQIFPAFAPEAGHEADGLVARRQQIADRRLHAAGARRRQRQDEVLRAVDVLQILMDLAEDLAE